MTQSDSYISMYVTQNAKYLAHMSDFEHTPESLVLIHIFPEGTLT